MPKYKDLNNDSGVAKYTSNKASIRVGFDDGSSYLYTNKSAGIEKVAIMQALAKHGDGLNAFINNFAYHDYAKKNRP